MIFIKVAQLMGSLAWRASAERSKRAIGLHQRPQPLGEAKSSLATAIFIGGTINMTLEFDSAKRLMTLRQRGLDFMDAPQLFEGNCFTRLDDRLDYGEERFITVGMLGSRAVVAVWTWRGKARRIISMRHANERESARYKWWLARQG